MRDGSRLTGSVGSVRENGFYLEQSGEALTFVSYRDVSVVRDVRTGALIPPPRRTGWAKFVVIGVGAIAAKLVVDRLGQ
jgi:hypothetical protein